MSVINLVIQEKRSGSTCCIALDETSIPIAFGSDESCDVIMTAAPKLWFSLVSAKNGLLAVKVTGQRTKLGGRNAKEGVSELPVSIFQRIRGVAIYRIVLDDLDVRIEVPANLTRFTIRGLLNSRPQSSPLPAGSGELVSNRSGRSFFRTFGTKFAAIIVALLGTVWVVQPSARTPWAPIGTSPQVAQSANKSRTAGEISDSSVSLSPVLRPISQQVGRDSVPLDQINSEMRNSMLRIGIQSTVKIEKSAQGLMLTGAVLNSEKQAVRSVASRLQQKYSMPVLDQTIVPATELNVQIRSSSSNPGFIVLDDGRRFMTGDLVQGGWVFYSINQTDVTFKRGSSVQTIVRR